MKHIFSVTQLVNPMHSVKSKKSLLWALVIMASATVSSAHAGDAARGEKLAQTCMGCHGAPGLRNPGPVYEVPMLAGQHAAYLSAALKSYKDGSRSHKTMQAQAYNLTDQDMEDISAYFAEMEGSTRDRVFNQAQVALGKEKAVTCASCHGADGNSQSELFPKIGGQYESYITQALKDYRSGDRQNPSMSAFAASLTIEDIEALAAWYASQKGDLAPAVITQFK